MIKMIVTDLDNTLLRSDKTISEYTVDVLKKCQSEGIKVIFATARSAQASSRFIERFTPDIFIGYGGAFVSAGDRVIRRIDISPEIAQQLIKEFLDAPEISCIYAINEAAAFTNDREFMAQEDMSHYQYTDFSNNYNHRYNKISVISSEPAAVEKIASRFPMCDMLRYRGEDLYKFTSREAVKWNAVKAISDYYNIGTDEFAAFGDDYIDLEMLQKCGVGIAVKNAAAEVRSAVKYICETNDNDGVAKWIEERVLKKN